MLFGFCNSVPCLFLSKLRINFDEVERLSKLLHLKFISLSHSLDAENCFDFLFLGSGSVGMDISFVGFKYVYGLPEHGDSFVLRSTL